MKFQLLLAFCILIAIAAITGCKKDPVKIPVKPKTDSTVTKPDTTIVIVKPPVTPGKDTVNQSLIFGTWHSVSTVPDYPERYFGLNNFYYESLGNYYGENYHFSTYVWLKNDTLSVGGAGGIKVKVLKLTADSLVFTTGANIYRYNNEHLPLLDPNGQITTLAGNDDHGYAGDGGLASAAKINLPCGITTDKSGNIYFMDGHNAVMREITVADNTIHTVAGIYNYYSESDNPGEDGLPALSTHLRGYESAMAVDNSGNIYLIQDVSFSINNRVLYKISAADHKMRIICGKTKGYSGDGGQVANAAVYYPGTVRCDAAGNVYIADQLGAVIRKITPGGIITTIAGNGTKGYSGDGGPAKSASINMSDFDIDKNGNIVLSNITSAANVAATGYIRMIDGQTGIITTIAGNGKFGYSGDGVDPKTAGFSTIIAIAINNDGDIYTAEDSDNNHRIRKITKATGKITTVAGNNFPVFSGDGNYLQLRSMLPVAMALDKAGNILISDNGNNRIRKITL